MLRETIKKNRLYASITQRRMADLLGISISKYLRKENGQYRMERDEVVKIARILKLDEKRLVTYWMADNLYEFMRYDKELVEEAIGIVKTNFDHYDCSIGLPARGNSFSTLRERSLRRRKN